MCGSRVILFIHYVQNIKIREVGSHEDQNKIGNSIFNHYSGAVSAMYGDGNCIEPVSV